MLICSYIYIVQVNQVNSSMRKALTGLISINLGHGSVLRLLLSTDCYGRAAQREKNKRRRTEGEGEEISETMKAMPGTHANSTNSE